MIAQSVIDELINRNDPAYSHRDGSYVQGFNGAGTFDSFKITAEDISRWSTCSQLNESDFYNFLSLFLALAFQSGKLPFGFCDHVVNYLFGLSSHVKNREIFWEIYLAFDKGEYYHDELRTEDPVEVYTRPTILATLAKYPPSSDIERLVNNLKPMSEVQIAPL